MGSAAASSERLVRVEVHAPPAFDEVYETHFDYTYRVVVRLAGRAHAEDLTQEVFAVVHRRLPEWEGRAKLTTWLFQIAFRVVGAHLRRERVRRLLLGAVSDEVVDHAPATAHGGIEHAEQSAALARALARLPWKKRAVLVLHDVEEWSCELIAERMAIPLATVWSRLHHARKQLADEITRDRRRSP